MDEADDRQQARVDLAAAANGKANDPERPQRISSQARKIADFLGERQRYYQEVAQDFGYSKEVLETVAVNFSHAADDPLFASTESSLKSFYRLVTDRTSEAPEAKFGIASQAYVLATTSTAASMTVSTQLLTILPGNAVTVPRPPPNSPSNPTPHYAARLSELHPELGRLLTSAWQSFYGGAENADRAALLSMRQLWDQFMEILAPDDKVRASSFFDVKSGDIPQQIHRIERIKYAAKYCVRDARLAKLLAAEGHEVLEIYKRLNMLHKRDRLDHSAVQQTLNAMEQVIMQWVDAIRS